jgi:hypothetical protein
MLRRLMITFTAAEWVALDRLALQDTRPVKDQVRALIRAEAERRHVWFEDPARADKCAPSAAELGRLAEDA